MKKYVYNESFKDKFLKKLYLFKLDIQIFFKYNKDVTRLLIIFLILLVIYGVKTGFVNMKVKIVF